MRKITFEKFTRQARDLLEELVRYLPCFVDSALLLPLSPFLLITSYNFYFSFIPFSHFSAALGASPFYNVSSPLPRHLDIYVTSLAVSLLILSLSLVTY